MTIPIKPPLKPGIHSPTDEISEKLEKLTQSEICSIALLSAPRRRRVHHPSSIRSTASFVAFIGCILLVDVFAVLSVDPKRPGPFTHFTGVQPTFHLCVMVVLHMITLICGLSRTVRGCRLAMVISWLFFLCSIGLLIFTPAFIASYVASGLAPIDQITFRAPKNETPADRFYAAFFMALGGQFFMFVLFLASIFQMTLVGELLREAHLLAKLRRGIESEEALVPPV